MKSSLFRRGVGMAAAGALALTGLAGISASADAATKTTLIIGDGVGWTSLNSGNPDENSAINADVGYLTGNGFYYYDNKLKVIRNTNFGTYGIVKDTPTDFEVKYTIKKGQVWSDGTPIDAVDLLLSHVLSSSDYSIKAGLGDPSSNDGSKFYSGGYGGAYDHHVVGLPILSKDHMSLTVKFDEYQPDWEVSTPGVSPVHTLEEMVDGRTTLQSASANIAAKAAFLDDYTKAYTGNSAAKATMAAIGEKWTNVYNFDSGSYNGDNQLLAVCNGAYKLQSYDYDSSTVTLGLNPKYTSGPALPKTNQVKTIVFKYVADGTASVQALQNGDINLYQGMPGAAGYSTLLSLKASKAINMIQAASASYEHIDLRTGDGPGTDDRYTGLFAASHGQKARDLRLAFLLALPRFATMSNQLKPFNPSATLLNSNFALPGSKYYKGITALNTLTTPHTVTIAGKAYSYNFNVTSAAQQKANEAVALKLVRKWYKTAGPGVDTAALHVNFLRSGRQMRVENNAVIVQHEGNVGFSVNNETTSAWSTKLSLNAFDAQEFAWSPNAVIQDGSNSQYLSDGSNNHMGWIDSNVDDLLHQVEGKLSDAEIAKKLGQAEALITANSWTLPIYQWPQVTAFSTSIKGVAPNSISPSYAWNYWQWHF